MRIAIDVSQIVYDTGVSVYTRNLVSSLLEIDKNNEYILFAGSLRRKQELKKFFDTRVFSIPPTLADMLWNRLHVYPIERLVGQVDVFHSSDWAQPPSKAFKVTTIHDLAPIKFSQWTNKKIVSVHKRRLKWVRREVDQIIVPSVSTKKSLSKLGISSSRVTVIPEASDGSVKTVSENMVKKLKEKYSITGSYLLAIGVGERKNTERTIEAFKKVREKLGIENLVIIGRTFSSTEKGSGVVFTGHVSKKELPVFYSGAECLVYASLYEGFGLPILESFTTSLPVVTSNTSSMPEVAGDAAVLVDPKSVDSITSGIVEAISNKDSLVKKGKDRVKEFSWQKAARKTLEVYNLAKA